MRKTKGSTLDPQAKNRGDANRSLSGRSYRRPLSQAECQCAKLSQTQNGLEHNGGFFKGHTEACCYPTGMACRDG